MSRTPNDITCRLPILNLGLVEVSRARCKLGDLPREAYGGVALFQELSCCSIRLNAIQAVIVHCILPWDQRLLGSTTGIRSLPPPCRVYGARLKAPQWSLAQASRQTVSAQLDYHERYQASSYAHGLEVVDWITTAGQVVCIPLAGLHLLALRRRGYPRRSKAFLFIFVTSRRSCPIRCYHLAAGQQIW